MDQTGNPMSHLCMFGSIDLTGVALAADKTDADFQFATAAALFGMKLRGMDEVSETAWDKVLALAKPGLADDVLRDHTERRNWRHRQRRRCR